MSIQNLFLYLLLALLWGGSFLFMRIAVPETNFVFTVTMRFVFALLALLPVYIYWNKIDWRAFTNPKIIWATMTNLTIPYALFSYALEHIDASYGAILNSTAVLFAVLCGRIFYHQKLQKIKIFGTVLGFIGVVLMVYSKLEHIPTIAPVVGCLFASFCYGYSGHYIKHNLKGYSALQITTVGMCFSSLLLLPTLFIYTPEIATITVQTWLAILCLGVLSTGVALLIFYYLIAHLGATQVITVTFAVPVVATMLGVWLLQEPFHWNLLLPLAMIFVGIYLTLK